MLRLILSRLGSSVLVIFAVATIAFFLMRCAPGGPFDEERSLLPEVQRNIEERYHLNDPLISQYADYIGGLAKLDFGQSLKRPQTVNELIAGHYGYSLTLGLMAIAIALSLGLTMGVAAAARRNTWVDHSLMSFALLGVSIPSIVLAPLGIAAFALHLGWLPPARAEGLSSYLLPAFTMGLIYTGTIARLTRAGMLEVLGQDFVRTARAKGLSERAVVWRHAVRLGVVPVATYLGPAMASMIAGSFVIEQIFQIPGLGFYFVSSVSDRDYPVLTGMLVFYVVILVALNLVSDLAHGALDPRVREQR
ncbi:MAG: ABC transporter permease [Kofleriaceae bacterium]